MHGKSHNHRAFLVLRVLFGLFFLFVGGQKFFQLEEFIMSVRAYQILFPPFDQYAAYFVASAEVVAGLFIIILGSLYRGSLYLTFSLCVVFIVALAYAWWRGLEINCGCFGVSENVTNYPIHIGFNALLILITGILLIEHKTWRKVYFKSNQAYKIPRT